MPMLGQSRGGLSTHRMADFQGAKGRRDHIEPLQRRGLLQTSPDPPDGCKTGLILHNLEGNYAMNLAEAPWH
jgi:hypothetical protein